MVPGEVWEMDMREANDLMAAWIDNPPAHVVSRQLRDVVISAFGGSPPSSRRRVEAQTPDQLAAVLGLGAP